MTEKEAGLCTRPFRLSRMMPLLLLATLSSVLAFSGLGLATSVATRTPCGMCEEQNRFVRLQTGPFEISSNSAPPFSHPAHVDPEDWARVLRRIRVQIRQDGFLFGSTKGPVTDAFTADEIQFLSATLTKAFAEARPEEVIVFGLARPRTPELTEITTGSWFIRGDALHLVLANYRTAVTLPGVRKLLWEEPLRTQAGLNYDLVPGERQTLVQSKDEDANPFGTPRPSQVAIQYRSMVRSEIPSGSSSAAPSIFPEARHTLEERLERLKRLREQGLITEEEYGMKKKELLDGL